MKRIVSLMFALAAVMMLWANPVSRNAARQTASLFAQKKGAQLAGEPRMAPGRLASAKRQPLYVFNMADNGGFVIVAGDDRALPVLGYATAGSYDEGLLPDNFRYWMENTAREIEALGDDEAGPGDDDPEAENDDSAQEKEDAGKRARIEPFIKTEWGQGSAVVGGSIYNMFCPEIGGRRALTGCVATVGAQIMYYYQHPKDSIGGVPGYVLDEAEVNTSEPLDSAVFKWDLMKQDYTAADHGTESAEAVAELMLYCGYAANMRYGLSGSGSNERVLAQNMTKYFDYDPYTWKYLSRSMFSVSAWEDIIYGELAEGRPVIYGGNSNKGGHAFLCDGYDGEGLYHFNWGWDGYLDGYFALYATNPFGDITDYGYIFDQTAIIGLQPNTGVVPEVEPVYDEPEEEEIIEGYAAKAFNPRNAGNNVYVYFENDNAGDYAFGFGLGELKEDGELIPVDTKYEYYKTNVVPSGSYYTGAFSFTLNKNNFDVGAHKIVPISIVAGEEEWHQCHPASNFFMVNIEEDEEGKLTMTIDVHPLERFTVNSFEVTSPSIPNERPTAVLSITNEGEFLNKNFSIRLEKEGKTAENVLFNIDGSIRYSTVQTMMIRPGATKVYTIRFYDALPAGNYTLHFVPSGASEPMSSTTFGLGTELEVTDFAIDGNRHRGSIQKADVTVHNLSGDYTKPLYLFASRTEEKGKNVYAAGVAVANGDSQTVAFYFRPDLAGAWNLWVALDEKGDEVVYHSVVTIVRDPEEVAKAVDVDGDAAVTLKDVAELSALIAGGTTPGTLFRADINGDGQADVNDLITVLKAMIPAEEEEEPLPEPGQEPADN